jgi:hypothetical protein
MMFDAGDCNGSPGVERIPGPDLIPAERRDTAMSIAVAVCLRHMLQHPLAG